MQFPAPKKRRPVYKIQQFPEIEILYYLYAQVFGPGNFRTCPIQLVFILSRIFQLQIFLMLAPVQKFLSKIGIIQLNTFLIPGGTILLEQVAHHGYRPGSVVYMYYGTLILRIYLNGRMGLTGSGTSYKQGNRKILSLHFLGQKDHTSELQ